MNADRLILEMILNRRSQENLVLHLVGENDRELSNESGYAPVVLAANRWIMSDRPAKAVYPEVVFIFNVPAGSVYGYFVAQQHSGEVMWRGKLPAPFDSKTPGDAVKIRLIRTFAQARVTS